MRYRNACERYVIDSDPLDDSVTTTDVLDHAHAVGAEVASLQDVYQDKGATVDSLLRGLETADDHAFTGELLLPLQAPYVECWEELGCPAGHWIGIGGLKDASTPRRLQATRALRQAVGDDAHLHGFGWGVSGGMAQAIRESPGLLDSLDYSTPMQNVDFASYESGKESMSVAAMHAATQLVTDLRACTPFIAEDPTRQQTIEAWK